MGYRGGYPEYVSVADKKKNAERAVAKMLKDGKKIVPIRIEGQKIAKSFWGKSWCDHLESFSDYDSRLPRGRSYVRHGAVLDLQVEPGKVSALVQGSSVYKITIEVAALAEEKWKTIRTQCAGEIGSLIELLQGKLSASVMKTVADTSQGLFPAPKDITFGCSCPDWADMCKHVAAALYGVGARLDHEPELLFVLRHVDHLELIGDAALPHKTKRTGKKATLNDKDISALFDIEMEGNGADDANARVGGNGLIQKAPEQSFAGRNLPRPAAAKKPRTAPPSRKKPATKRRQSSTASPE
jgi:uncharacterized Zn finger protein